MKKVVLSDDNYIVSEGIKLNIDWNELNAEIVLIAKSGQEVLNYIIDNHVDLIITDIEMPNLNGISLSREAIKINPYIKIILISAYDKFEYAKQAVSIGVYDYIEKPIDYDFLYKKIKSSFEIIDREQRNLSIVKESRQLMITKFFQELLYFSTDKTLGYFDKYISYLELDISYSHFNLSKCKIFDNVYYIQDLNNLIFIIAKNSKTPAHFQYVIHNVISSFIDNYKSPILNINVGIGTIVDSISKLHVSYENACHALKYRFFYPNQSIFDAVEATGKEFSLLSTSDSDDDELIGLLCKKDNSSIEEWLKNFFDDLSTKYKNKNIMFIRIYSLLGKILRFLYEINIDTKDLEERVISVYSRFDTFHTYEQFLLWMRELCNLVCDKLNFSLKSYHEHTYELVDNYIKNNFEDNTLSLNDIAKYANMSPSYLSALYKKNNNQSISDTITSYRIDAAKEYLIKTNLSLKEISIKCGYANQYYFSTSFKKQLGISPSGYREQYSSL